MGDALLDLVCGPASPLPETYQRYRLVAHLGSGGQAEVYRAVRLCGGVSSAPMTVKVFRIDPRRPLVDELRSWDKGDAALMDLNNRGVTGICRRADGFYGPPPHRPGEAPEPGNAVPYQVYDYLHGVNLREYLKSASANAGIGPRLNALGTLRTLSTVLRALHEPADAGATPVLHMDVKPSNVMVLTTGEVRLIDFTGARYWRTEEITQIAYTPESGGPEALSGRVGPAYDVHGLGAVAFFLVTGVLPRGKDAPPPQTHPLLGSRPALRELLMAPLAENPADRPDTTELPKWVERLSVAVRSTGVPENGVDWAEPDRPAAPSRAVGRASVVGGTETDAFRRIERLERELVELRGNRSSSTGPVLATAAYAGRPLPGVADPAKERAAAGVGTLAGPNGTKKMAHPGSAASMAATGMPAAAAADRPVSGGAVPGQGGSGQSSSGQGGSGAAEPMRGRASVVTKPPPGPDIPEPLPERPRQPRPPMRTTYRLLKRGGGWTWFGAIVAFLGWSVWAIANRGHNTFVPAMEFGLVLLVGAGLFTIQRVIGRFVVERWMHRKRNGAILSHLGTAVYLTAVGVDYFRQTPWVISVVTWFQGQH